MSPLRKHERGAELLNRFIIALTEELGLPLDAGGSTTLRRRRKLKGLEPDKCFWIANEPRVRGKEKLNLRTDPPPDLAIEVDITNSSLDRMGIYAALRVPELWRLDESGLTFHILAADGNYREVRQSQSFDFVSPADLVRFLALRATLDNNAVVRQFRAWVRQQQQGGNLPPAPTP
jgi:Uma2 family endonuclease